MANYIGIKCPVCSKKFAQPDDIVVCPACGAPHHRHCYMETGNCIFAEEHSSGKEWQAPQEDRPPQEEGPGATKACPACGANNPQQSIYCQVCGTMMAGAHQHGQQDQQEQGGQGSFAGWVFPNYGGVFSAEQMLYGGLKPEEKIGEETVQDLAIYIGPNAAGFLPRFKNYSTGASHFSFSLPACLLSYFYYFYRKMYGVGLVMLAISICTLIPYMLYLREMLPDLVKTADFAPFMRFLQENRIPFNLPSDQVDVAMANLYGRIFSVMRVVNIALRMFFASISNMVYYRKVTSAVACIRDNVGSMVDKAQYQMVLARSGGVRASMVLLCGLVYAVAFVTLSNYVFRGIL